MAILPPRDVPIVDRATGLMNQKWYRYFFERDLENQPQETSSYIEFIEMTAPASPADQHVRLFASDAGAGKTQLSALFPTGAIQVVKVEP